MREERFEWVRLLDVMIMIWALGRVDGKSHFAPITMSASRLKQWIGNTILTQKTEHRKENIRNKFINLMYDETDASGNADDGKQADT